MILRGAQMSESRQSIGPARPAFDEELSLPPAAPAPVIVERLVPVPITRESIAEWLEQGDDRPWLAAQLADDVETLRAAARVEGFTAGEAAGLAKAKEQTASAIRSLAALEEEARSAFDTEVATLAGLCSDIVCAAIAKIVGPTLGSREAAVGAVLEVLKRVKDERELTVRVSAHDLPALQESREEIERACGGRSLSFVEDVRVESGGCIVESRLGSFDGRFEVQLRRLMETLRDAKAAPAELA